MYRNVLLKNNNYRHALKVELIKKKHISASCQRRHGFHDLYIINLGRKCSAGFTLYGIFEVSLILCFK